MANLVSIKTCKNDDQSGLKPMTQWRPLDGVISNWCQPCAMIVLARCVQTDYISEPWVQSSLITLSLQSGDLHIAVHTRQCHTVTESHKSHVTQCHTVSHVSNLQYLLSNNPHQKMFSLYLWIDFINLCYHLIPLSSAIVQFLSV